MKLETAAFGSVEVTEDEVIHFTSGILGFPGLKRYVLLTQDNTLFKFLQAVDDPELTFVMIMPELVRSDYSCPLGQEHAEELCLEHADDAEVYCIVTIPDNLADMTVNLQAPVIINTKQRLAKQVVLLESHYHTRHNVLAEMQQSAFEHKRQSSYDDSSTRDAQSGA